MEPKPQKVVLEEIFKSLQCQICLETMTDPRTLPCGHNFCRECINNLATTTRRSRSAILKCPNSCHQTIRIDDVSVRDLPRNFTLYNIIESMNNTKRCESHDDVVGFINMADGKLLCEHCLKDEQSWRTAQADLSDTSSTTTMILSRSMPPEILTLSIAEDVIKSNLEHFTVQSKSLVAQMKSLEIQVRKNLKASEESKMRAKQEIDNMISSFVSALTERRSHLKSLIDSMDDDIDKSAASLSKAIATISKTAEDTSVLLNAQRGQAAQEKLIPFLTSAIQLQSSFAPNLDAASKALDAANVIKSPSDILVTCPPESSFLVNVKSPDLFKITRADDIPASDSKSTAALWATSTASTAKSWATSTASTAILWATSTVSTVSTASTARSWAAKSWTTSAAKPTVSEEAIRDEDDYPRVTSTATPWVPSMAKPWFTSTANTWFTSTASEEAIGNEHEPLRATSTAKSWFPSTAKPWFTTVSEEGIRNEHSNFL